MEGIGVWHYVNTPSNKILLFFCSALKSVPVLSAEEEQYSSAVLLSETSHVRLLFLDLVVVVVSVRET